MSFSSFTRFVKRHPPICEALYLDFSNVPLLTLLTTGADIGELGYSVSKA